CACCREQYLFNVFEVIVSTLETKLQRIENLDKAVEHLMRRVEALDSRVNDNIDKTDSVISKLRAMDQRLFQAVPGGLAAAAAGGGGAASGAAAAAAAAAAAGDIDNRLVSLDQKVSDIGSKLSTLKNQLDTNFLPADDINAEASEKKPVSMNVVDIGKVLSAEVTRELQALRTATASVDRLDRKLTFHMNLVSENLGKVLSMVNDVHEAVVEHVEAPAAAPASPVYRNRTATTTTTTTTEAPSAQQVKRSKLDRLVKQMHPILSVSEKMDEVWDVVVGTKTSVDDLVPKSDELLTQTQRQERAINDVHADLRQKANKIIANLDLVEKRLKKQEDDVVSLAQRPVPAELLLDPTIDRLVEYDSNRYSVVSSSSQVASSRDDLQPETDPLPGAPVPAATLGATTTPGPVFSVQGQLPLTVTPSAPVLVAQTTLSPLSPATSSSTVTSTPGGATSAAASAAAAARASRNRGVIFPSVKNKPTILNTSFTSDYFSVKDVKGYSCVDLLNAGMRHSGVYYLQIRGTTYWFLKVFCEQEIADGGWTVIQRRDDFGDPRENFNRDWADYKNGFGDPAKEFWLGNENIYMLTNNEEYQLRVELEDFEGNKRYAQYSHFKIYSEAEYYKLEIDGYEGNAGDSLNDPWYGSNNSPFSTYNRDNDRSSLNCASMLKGGWWWKSCGRGLNGLYLNDPQDLTARQGIVWFRWRGWDYTLKRASMMIRPKGPGSST
ncbi:Techylectin-5B, partial [Frankliniella fusca]